jgi:hypothetical protein
MRIARQREGDARDVVRPTRRNAPPAHEIIPHGYPMIQYAHPLLRACPSGPMSI